MKTYIELISSQASFIMSKQILVSDPDDAPTRMYGAIKNTNDSVIPYFSNLAAIALSLSGEPGSLEAVADYLTWYLNHVESHDATGLAGTIYDYGCPKEDPVWRSREKYDSADSYAATFMSLLRAYVEAGGNTQFLAGFRHTTETVADVMVALMEDDNLTIARRGNEIKYLMDNCEVYRGLVDAAWLLERVFHDAGKATYFHDWAQKNRQAILTELANDAEMEFYVSKGRYSRARVHWDRMYPDMRSQLFPVMLGVIDADDPRARRAYQKLTHYHRNWLTPDRCTPPDKFPGARVAYAAAVMGEFGDVARFKEAMENKYIDKGHSPEWLPMEAAWLILACLRSEFVAGRAAF